jgi:hypothetical protein
MEAVFHKKLPIFRAKIKKIQKLERDFGNCNLQNEKSKNAFEKTLFFRKKPLKKCKK